MPAAGTVVNERYELIERLGGGAFGETWAAADRQGGAQVVCKLIGVRGMSGWKPYELFEREVAVLRSVQHADVPRFVDSFETQLSPGDVTLVLVMERVVGQTLQALIAGQMRWDETRARRTLERLLEVLQHLHTLSPPVIHRDIKPANVIVRPNGDPALVDFGAVRDLGARADGGAMTVVGTAGYMPPEQALGVSLPASDLFALGATMVHALTHVHPADLPRRGMRWRFETLLGCSPALVAVLARLVEPDVDRRYATAAEALADLRAPAPAVRALERAEPVRALAVVLPEAPRELRAAAASRIEVLSLSQAMRTSAAIGLAGMGLAGFFLITTGSVFGAVSVAFVSALSVPVSWVSTRRSAKVHYRDLYEKGPIVRGRVFSVDRRLVGNVAHVDIGYTYDVDKRRFTGELNLGGDAVAVEVGDPVVVVYDADRPRTHVASVSLDADVLAQRLGRG